MRVLYNKRLLGLITLFIAFTGIALSLMLVEKRQNYQGKAQLSGSLSFYCSFDNTLDCENNIPLESLNISFAEGIFNRSVAINQINSLLSYQIPNNVSTANGSVEIWVKFPFDLSDQKNLNQVIFQLRDNELNNLTLALNEGNKFLLQFKDKILVTPPANFRKNYWHYFTVTWGNGVLKLYQNGKMLIADQNSVTEIKFPARIYLGSDSQGKTPLSGCIDQFKILTEELSNDQIVHSWNSPQLNTPLKSFISVNPNELPINLPTTFDVNLFVNEELQSGSGIRLILMEPNNWLTPEPNINLTVLINDLPDQKTISFLGCIKDQILNTYCEAIINQAINKNTKLTFRLGANADGSPNQLYIIPDTKGKAVINVAIDNNMGYFFEIPKDKQPYIYLK